MKKNEEDKKVTKNAESVETSDGIESEVKPSKKDVKSAKKVVNIKNELKRNAKDIEVEIMNITCGSIFYNHKGEIIDLEYPGETCIVSLKYLDEIKRKGLLDKLSVSITDIYSDDYTVEDVVSYLGLNKLYADYEMNLDAIDDLLESSEPSEFEELVKKANKIFVARICERAVKLSKENKFDSNYKRIVLEEVMGNGYIFRSI